MAEVNTALLLREWALWIHEHDGPGRGFGGCTLANMIPPKGAALRERSSIDDGIALTIDAHMAELKKFELFWYEILRVSNENPDWGDRRIAAYFKTSRYFAAQAYSDAYEWIDDRLTKNLQKAA